MQMQVFTASSAPVLFDVDDDLTLNISGEKLTVTNNSTSAEYGLDDVKKINYIEPSGVSDSETAPLHVIFENSHITASGLIENEPYSLVNLSGQVIFSDSAHETINIDMNDYPAGIYIFTIGNRLKLKLTQK